MNNAKGANWRKPELKEIKTLQLIESIKAKALSDPNSGYCYGGNVLQGVGGGVSPSVPGVGGDWMLYCIEVGPLGGCNNWMACAVDAVPIASNKDDSSIY